MLCGRVRHANVRFRRIAVIGLSGVGCLLLTQSGHPVGRPPGNAEPHEAGHRVRYQPALTARKLCRPKRKPDAKPRIVIFRKYLACVKIGNCKHNAQSESVTGC